ncbi:Hypothetical protein GbCGDNIH9_8625 [Granulibacter bethesdensis]|uniref:Uncharacterized protein n=1 Tax=Granulibacter bethesdensis TaxID=364410 RepID=A0AAC9P8X7_9PROT|nr:Hypothetical protein GbCGDNIH9_8625 [Granulibacter bethesdensis]APH62564.1 Hypothetical protein GbCGDNIH8_8625 [Granulibacter bethesdensis]
MPRWMRQSEPFLTDPDYTSRLSCEGRLFCGRRHAITAISGEIEAHFVAQTDQTVCDLFEKIDNSEPATLR